MARMTREEQFSPDEIAIAHVMNRAVRRCFLMGFDQYTGLNYNYRKQWIQERIEHLAKYFGIDVLCFSILSNHVHLVLRQRPDVVKTWDDSEVARRWCMLCPEKKKKRKKKDVSEAELSESQLNSIRNDPAKLRNIRCRLSDISWWMRLMCQTIAQRINAEDQATGKVFENRFRAVRLLDEAALLACSAYVDLNPIRAAMAETLETSDHTSVQRRIEELKQQVESENAGVSDSEDDRQVLARDRMLAPVELAELRDALQVLPSGSGYRCSDRGFLNMTAAEYIQLLDWTARSILSGKRGTTAQDIPPIFERLGLGLSAHSWCELVRQFGKLFRLVAGRPHIVDAHRGQRRGKRFHLPRKARELMLI